MGKHNPKHPYKVTKYGRKKRRGQLSNLKNQGLKIKPDVEVHEILAVESHAPVENGERGEPNLSRPDNEISETLVTKSNVSVEKSEGSNIKDSTYTTEELIGNRIVELKYFIEKLKQLNNMDFIQERRHGLRSDLFMKCNMCGESFKLSTLDLENETSLNINTAAVAGSMSTGGGYSAMEELLSVMNIPVMSSATYVKHHSIVSDGWETSALEKMKEAAQEEAAYAKAIDSIDEEGYPLVPVVADGAWCKRSYKTNYSALSGVAAIVGQHTRKVLYIGVKNKFCTYCTRAATLNKNPSEHDCGKNYSGSSSSMESAILTEGFKANLEMYGIKYNKIIADGDSSTYKKILEARPYNNITVEKIECRNHLLRNYRNKLQAISTDTHNPIELRKLLSARILRMRTAIMGAIRHYKSYQNKFEAIQLLKKDIDNSVAHVFGQHANCAQFFCKAKEEENLFSRLQSETQMYVKILQAVKYVANNARSLIHDVDSNIAEQFNSVIAKFVEGKRINFALNKSYQARCAAAAVSFNTKRPHYHLHKTIKGSSPGSITKNMENRRIKKVNLAASRRLNRVKKHAPRRVEEKRTVFGDKNYGEHCERPDMSPELLLEEKTIFLNKLNRTADERSTLEQETILQAESGKWIEERRKLLTASNFHKVCRRRKTTSCLNLVRQLLYDASKLNISSINHGRNNEEQAKEQLAKQEGIKIVPCGLFVDESLCFLAATPDGLVENNNIVEVKCPITAGKIKFWKQNTRTGQVEINRQDKWYYQIQGQMHVTKRDICIFGIWTVQNIPMKVEYVRRDDIFWNTEMKQQLTKFYMDCILPELVDPTHTRNMPIRDPDYIVKEIEDAKNLKKMSSPKKIKLTKRTITPTKTTPEKPCSLISAINVVETLVETPKQDTTGKTENTKYKAKKRLF